MKLLSINISLLIATILPVCASAAENTPCDSISADTVVVIENAHQLSLTENSGGVTITITGKDDNPNYTYTYHSRFTPDAIVKTHQQSSEWGLSFPLAIHSSPKSKNEIIVGGLAFGWMKVAGQPSNMVVAGTKSWEIMLLNALAYQRRLSDRDFLSVGIGIDWRNYRLDDNLRYTQADDGTMSVETYSENVWEQSSRIKTFSWLVPVIYKHRFGKNFKTWLGAILCLNSYASVKTKYRIEERQIKEFSDDISHSVVTCDFIAGISCSGIGLYAKYSPCNVLKTRAHLEFTPISGGIILGF